MALKKTVLKKLLLNRDWDGILSWWQQERSAQRVVLSMLFDSGPLLKWRTVQALGCICGFKAPENIEWVRGVVRHLLWGMNDESGNLIWIAPEALAEVLLRVPSLIDEYAEIVISNHDLEPFEAGVHLFMARISAVKPELLKKHYNALLQSLQNSDPKIRLFAAIALKNADPQFEAQFVHLISEAETVEIYDFSESVLKRVSVASVINAHANDRAGNFIALG
ncbi:MAG: hypothetical protein H8E46_04030 [FCB group bacterium]|nr:hypothetical protein [FCB group bacterium]